MNSFEHHGIVSYFSETVLDNALKWLCHQRMNSSPNNDIWQLRTNWLTERESILASVRSGTYQFLPQRRFYSCYATEDNKAGRIIDVWSARDAVVLKALTIILADILPVHETCTHIKGNGGLKRAVRVVQHHLSGNRFAFRTDVKSYYASIDHLKLLDRLSIYVRDKKLLNLVGQYLKRSTEYGGTFRDFDQGISRGCPLSPLIAAFYLHELDEAMAGHPVLYIRYMDDIVVLATNRHKLRRAIATVNSVLSSLGLKKHPDKTSIGLIERGFDFLGYHFCRKGISLAQTTVGNFLTKLSRLYEQNRTHGRKDWGWSPKSQPARSIETTITTYINRFRGWANGGLHNVPFTFNADLEAMFDHGCGGGS